MYIFSSSTPLSPARVIPSLGTNSDPEGIHRNQEWAVSLFPLYGTAH